ncbi:hypothetical protein BRC83_04885 [Halobacteriales archaeon QS_1_68_17]|nr:MAG: hypothetical protein BRC83_04885 [Halobacteriales archaeon QS_1_68_17]
MASAFARLIGSVGELARMFGDVALGDPLGAVLLAVGAVLTLAPVAVVGYLTLGMLADLVTPR